MTLTPALNFLLSNIVPSLIGPAALSVAFYSTLGQQALPGRRLPLQLSIFVGTTWIVQAVIASTYASLKESRAMRRLKAVRAPTVKGYLPWNIDLGIKLIRNYHKEYVGEEYVSFKDDLGDVFHIQIFGDEAIMVGHPGPLEEILVSDADNYIKGAGFQTATRSLLGNGIFVAHGDAWKSHRAMVEPFFNRERITDFDIFDRNAALAIHKIRERCNNDQPIDAQDLLSRFALDSATECLLGVSAHSLSSPLPLAGEIQPNPSTAGAFARAIQSALRTVVDRLRYTASIWQRFRIFGNKTSQDVKTLYAFIDPVIDRVLLEREERRLREDSGMDIKTDGADESTFPAYLLAITDDKQVVRNEIVNVMVAGRDSTATTLSFVTYLLVLHPDVKDKLRKEIMEVVGATECPTFDQIKTMSYLRAVLNETLRLFPPIPVSFRESVEERVLVNPADGARYYIPAGMKVVWNTIGIHRDPRFWGPDALEFSPERWLDDRKRYRAANPYAFLPFEYGLRVCVGQQFAYNEASFFLVRLLQQFYHIELAPEAQPAGSRPPEAWASAKGHTRKPVEQIMPRSHLTTFVQGGLWVKMWSVAEGESDDQWEC